MQHPVHLHGLHTHEVISVFDYNLSHIGKIQAYPRTEILSLPVHICTLIFHVRDCLTFSSPALPGENSFPVILWSGAQLPLPSCPPSLKLLALVLARLEETLFSV